MLKKYIAFLSALSILITALCCVPASAEQATPYPYIYYDFEEEGDISSPSAYGSIPMNATTQAYDSWVEGAGGSKGAMYRALPRNGAHSNMLLGYDFTSNPKDLFSGKVKISFWFKLDSSKTQLGGDRDAIKLFMLKGDWQTYKDFGDSFQFNRETVNGGEWNYFSYEIDWNGQFRDGTYMKDDPQDQTYTLQFRVCEGNGVVRDSITSESQYFAYAIDDFRIEPVSAFETDSNIIKYDFNESTDIGSSSAYGMLLTTQGGGTAVWSSAAKNGAGALYRTIPKSCNVGIMTYDFTSNPKLLFDGGFTLSFWMKIDTSQTTITGNRDEFRIVIYRDSGGYKTLDIVVPRADFATGNWVNVTKTINWDGSFSNGSNMQTDGASETYSLEIRAFEGNGKVVDSTSSDNFVYWLDDFSIAPKNYVNSKPALNGLSITGNVVEGNEIGISASWDGGSESKTEGNSIVRILKETVAASGKFVTVKEFIGSDKSQMIYEIPDSFEGLKIKIEAIPVASDGTIGSYSYSESVSVLKGTEYTMELTAFDQGTVTANITMLNRNKDGNQVNAVLAIVMYDEKNEIIRYVEKPVSCANTSSNTGSDVPQTDYLTMSATTQELPKVSYACAYLWDTGEDNNVNFLNTLMYELAPMKIVENN